MSGPAGRRDGSVEATAPAVASTRLPATTITVVVSHNQPDRLERAVTTWLHHHDGLLVVALSAPTVDAADTAADLARAHHLPVATYDTNIGFNLAANRTLARWANPADYGAYAVINDDTWFTSPAVNELAAHLDRDATLAAVGPRQVDEQNRITAGGFFGDPPIDRLFHQSAVPLETSADATRLAGSMIVWRATAWQQLATCPGTPPDAHGAYAPTSHYFGETFACVHARAHGWRLGFAGDVTVGHTWHASSPVGGYGEQHIDTDRRLYETLCDHHTPPIKH